MYTLWQIITKNTVAYIQIPKSSLSHPLFYQSRSMQGVIPNNYLNFVTILSNITQSQKSNFLSFGNGIVVRTDIKNITDHGIQLCVAAVVFKEKLNISDYLT